MLIHAVIPRIKYQKYESTPEPQNPCHKPILAYENLSYVTASQLI